MALAVNTARARDEMFGNLHRSLVDNRQNHTIGANLIINHRKGAASKGHFERVEMSGTINVARYSHEGAVRQGTELNYRVRANLSQTKPDKIPAPLRQMIRQNLRMPTPAEFPTYKESYGIGVQGETATRLFESICYLIEAGRAHVEEAHLNINVANPRDAGLVPWENIGTDTSYNPLQSTLRQIGVDFGRLAEAVDVAQEANRQAQTGNMGANREQRRAMARFEQSVGNAPASSGVAPIPNQLAEHITRVVTECVTQLGCDMAEVVRNVSRMLDMIGRRRVSPRDLGLALMEVGERAPISQEALREIMDGHMARYAQVNATRRRLGLGYWPGGEALQPVQDDLNDAIRYAYASGAVVEFGTNPPTVEQLTPEQTQQRLRAAGFGESAVVAANAAIYGTPEVVADNPTAEQERQAARQRLHARQERERRELRQRQEEEAARVAGSMQPNPPSKRLERQQRKIRTLPE